LLVVCSWIAALQGWPSFAVWADEKPRYDVEVMAVISKAGCNMGACHGNATGKGGMKISLRGEDPLGDHHILARVFAGRRVNVQRPEESLLLLKPTGSVPHQGGVRFQTDSEEYRILRDWIADGAKPTLADSQKLVALEVSPREQVIVEPAESVQLKAVAKFSSGEEMDVTRLACYEPSNLNATVNHDGLVARGKFGEVTVVVRFLHQQVSVPLAFVPNRPGFAWSEPPVQNFVDEHIYAKLKSLRMNPSPLADDSTFLRRVYLDCIGVPPTAEEARAFVADSSPDKRRRVIDALLNRPEFADFWALKWSDLLRNEEKVLDPKGGDAFHTWIRDSIAAGKPLDQFVRELVSSRGSTYEQPAANFYRANRDPFTRSETTARLFLGVRLQCARCHNHPFDRWTQDDYYNWAAWFSQIEYQILANKRRDNLDKNAFDGEQIIHILTTNDVKNARTGDKAVPRFLGDETPELPAVADRLTIMADWLTSPDNELFAKSQVNFVWYHLMSRGLIEPIDDVRATNPASHPELLDTLCREFTSHKFDLRHLVRTILNSRTYQLSSEPNDTNIEDEANYARARVRRLAAEQLVDAQSAVLGVSPKFPGYPEGTRAVQVKGVRRGGQGKNGPSEGDRLLKILGKPERLLACECERSNETTLSQAFLAISDEGLQQRLADEKNRLSQWLKAGLSTEAAIDELYWTALARPPTAQEKQAALSLCESSDDKFVALQDIAWALLNAKEFMFRR
jgi:hypothetical protein